MAFCQTRCNCWKWMLHRIVCSIVFLSDFWEELFDLLWYLREIWGCLEYIHWIFERSTVNQMIIPFIFPCEEHDRLFIGDEVGEYEWPPTPPTPPLPMTRSLAHVAFAVYSSALYPVLVRQWSSPSSHGKPTVQSVCFRPITRKPCLAIQAMKSTIQPFESLRILLTEILNQANFLEAYSKAGASKQPASYGASMTFSQLWNRCP